MSQVIRKFATGGQNTTPKIYGKVTIDGTEHDVTDDFLAQFTNFAKSQGSDNDKDKYLSALAADMRAGNHVSIDTISGNVSGSSMGLTGRAAERARTGRTAFGNLIPGRATKAGYAANTLKGFSYTKPTEAPKDKKGYDWSKKIGVEYEKGADGKFVVDEQGRKKYVAGPISEQVIKSLRSMKDISKYEEDSEFKGYNGLGKQAYIDYYNRVGDAGIEDLISRIQGGSYTANDEEVLNDFGFFLGANQGVAPQETPEQVAKREAADAKAKADAETARKRAAITSMGIDPDAAADRGLQFDVDENGKVSWINPSSDRYYAAEDPILGKLGTYWWNNQWYGKDAINSNNALRDAFQPLYSAWDSNGTFSDKLTAAQASGVGFYGGQNPYTGIVDINKNYYENGLHNFLYGKKNANPGESGIWEMADLTPDYNVSDGEQLVSYISSTSGKDAIGKPIERYAIKRGNQWFDLQDLSGFTKRSGYSGRRADFRGIPLDDQGKGQLGVIKSTQGDSRDSTVLIDTRGNLYINDRGSQKQVPADKVSQVREMIRSGKPVEHSVLRKILYGNSFSSPVAQFDQSVSLRKKGGHIPKFQNGGTSWRAIGTTSSIAEKDEEKKGLEQSGKLNAGWKEMSGADKTQLIAIGGDISALLASMVGGGNPVAAGLGTASTLTQFGSDIARDGFQWKDAGNMAIGLGLDALTLIPGVGIGSKMLKTVRVLRGAKKLLGGYFAAKGLIAAGTSLAKLTSDNEKNDWTVDDVRNIAMGLQGLVGGKRLLTDRALATQPGAKSTGEVKSKVRKTFTPEEITLKRNAIIDEKLKANPELQAKFQKDSGVTTETTTLGSDGKPMTVTAKTTDYDAAAKELLSKAELDELKNPTLLGKGIDQVKEVGSKAKGWVSDNTQWLNPNIGNKQRRVLRDIPDDKNSFLAWMQRRAQNRWLIDHPEYGTAIGTRIGFWSGKENPLYGAPIYSRHPLDPRTVIQGRYGSKPVDIEIIRNPSEFKKGGILKYQRPGGPIRNPYTRSQMPLDDSNEANPTFGRYSNTPVTPASTSHPIWGNRTYVPGQSVVQAPVEKVTPLINTPTPKAAVSTPIAKNTTPVASTFTPPPAEGPIVTDRIKAATANIGFGSGTVAQAMDDVKAKLSAQLQNDAKTRASGVQSEDEPEKGAGINKDMLLGIADYIVSKRANQQAADRAKEGLRRGAQGALRQMPTEVYSRWTDNGLNAAYNQRIKNTMGAKTISNDMNTVMAENMMREMQADQLRGERDATLSSMYGQYQNQNLAQKQQYANMRTDVANHNSKVGGMLAESLAQVDTQLIGQQAQNNKSLIYQLRQDYGADMNRKAQAQDQLNQMNANAEFQKWGQDFMAGKQDEWDAYVKANPDHGTTRDAWMKDHYAGDFANQERDIYSKLLIDRANAAPRFWGHFGNWTGMQANTPQIGSPYQAPAPRNTTWLTPYQKRGGTLKNTTNRHREVSEQHFLDQQKEITKSLREINNNVMKIFLKMMS